MGQQHTESDSKIGQWQGGAPNLSQAKPTSKQLNLHSPSDADGLKGGGCPTRADSHFVTVRGIFQRIEQCLAGSFKRSIYLEGSTISIETIIMTFKRAKIVACEARPNYILWVRFDDGIEGEVNLSDLVNQGVFKAWESEAFWKSVKVDPESDTVCWGEEIDLDPYVLKQEILDAQKLKPPTKDSKSSTSSQE